MGNQIKVTVSKESSKNSLDMLYGINVEHMGRTMYGGVYQDNLEISDEQGFRKDVFQALKDMNLSCVRYPGGNFVSGYCWRDGIGKKENRPIRLNLAWKQVEPNTVGIHEFGDYVERLGTQLLMNFNLGYGSVQDNVEMFEYCNFTGDTTLTRERKENGREKPFNIKYWCLGNEMDGRWQICNLPAEEYGRKAKEVARLVKLIDPEVKLVLVGSSKPLLKTFADWDKRVLDIAYENVDYLSMHSYYDCPDYFTYKNKSVADYVGVYKEVEKNIKLMASIIQETKLRKKSKHDVYISYDEWNIWHRDPKFINENRFSGSKEWLASDPRIECIYDFKDAVLLVNTLNTFIKNSDVVKIACLCQAVNCIAPIITSEDGKMFKQTIYYPYQFAGNYLKGEYVPVDYDSGVITSQSFGDYQKVNIVSTLNGNKRGVLAVNNSETEDFEIVMDFPCNVKTTVSQIMKYHPDATNGFEREEVVPKAYKVDVKSNKATFKLPAFSIVMLVFEQ